MVSRTFQKEAEKKKLHNWINWINRSIAAFLVLFLVDRGCANPGPLPVFTDTPTNVTAVKGDKAILRCGIENLGTKTVIWRKQPYKVPIIVGKEQFLEIKRFQLLHVPHQDEWNLLIKNTQTHDSGTYECQVSLKGYLIRRNVTLTVAEIPSEYLAPRISISGTQFVEKGASIHLVCNVTSNDGPPQSVDWFKDGSPLQTSYSRQIYIQQSVSIASRKLVSAVDITKAQMSDTGVYVCRASEKLATRIKVDVLNAETYNEKRDAQSGSVRLSSRSKVIKHSYQLIILMFLLILFSSL